VIYSTTRLGTTSFDSTVFRSSRWWYDCRSAARGPARYALLRKSGGALVISTDAIAERFIQSYWRQAVPYPAAADTRVLRRLPEREVDAQFSEWRPRRCPSCHPGYGRRCGGSLIVGPLGEVLVGPYYGGERILTSEIETSRIAEGKFDLDVNGHYARPDVFRLELNESLILLPARISEVSVGGLRAATARAVPLRAFLGAGD
jgi:hypothetical protein